MIMEDYRKWKTRDANDTDSACMVDDSDFEQFFLAVWTDRSAVMQEVVTDLAKQIYHLQMCIEGLIEDSES